MDNLEERIELLLNAIISVAQGDYTVDVKLSGKNDELDALAMGINLMIDDLRTKHETDEENIKIKELNRQLELARKKAEESDHLKSAFLANMSHEIRTPMNGILGFADLLKKSSFDKEKNKKYIGLIEESGKRMLHIINEIIDISKIESGQMDIFLSETYINNQLKYIYGFFKPETDRKGIQLIVDEKILSQPGPIMMTDKEKLSAILTNLTKNAIKFTDNGSVEIGYIKKNGCIEFFVKDTGIGIPQDKMEYVFDRFARVENSLLQKQEGTGLGLAISKAYVEMLGGKMWLHSVEGNGSTFYFTISDNINTSLN